VNRPQRKSILCPNCRKLISIDESRCPHCGIRTPGARWKNNPLTRGWGSGEKLVRTIIFTNIGMFVLSIAINPRSLGMSLNPLTFFSPSPESLAALGATGTYLMHASSGWWTLITANYLHGSILHIFFNLVVLYQISPLINQLYGPHRYFIVYTVSGVCGFLVSYWAGVSLTLGASAALCGLIGAAIYYGKSRGGHFGQAVFKQLGGWALAILLFGFLVPRVNNWAHIGGLLSGALASWALGYNEKYREKLAHRVISAVCIIITALTLGWGVLRGVLVLFGA
jgi:membrane associated rhomboid family serine protease